MSDDRPTTDELRVEQVQRELREHARARAADDPVEERAHDRRAERAAYLRDKLAERARAERAARRS